MRSSLVLFLAAAAAAVSICSAELSPPSDSARVADDLAALERDTSILLRHSGDSSVSGPSSGDDDNSEEREEREEKEEERGESATSSSGGGGGGGTTATGARGVAERAWSALNTDRVVDTVYSLIDLSLEFPIPAAPMLFFGVAVSREETLAFAGARVKDRSLSELEGSIKFSVGAKLGRVARVGVNFVGYAKLGIEQTKADLANVDMSDEYALMDESRITYMLRPYRSLGALVTKGSASMIKRVMASRLDALAAVYRRVSASTRAADRVRKYVGSRLAGLIASVSLMARATERAEARAAKNDKADTRAIRRSFAAQVARRLRMHGTRGVWRADGRAGVNALLSTMCPGKVRSHVRSLWNAAREAVRERDFTLGAFIDDYGSECAELIAPEVTGLYDDLEQYVILASHMAVPPPASDIVKRVTALRDVLVGFAEDLDEGSAVLRKISALRREVDESVGALVKWCDDQMKKGPKISFAFSFEVGVGGGGGAVVTGEISAAANGGLQGTIDPESPTKVVESVPFGGFVINGVVEKRGLEVSGFVRKLHSSSPAFNLKKYGHREASSVHVKVRVLLPTDLGLFKGFAAESVIRNPHIPLLVSSLVDTAKALLREMGGEKVGDEGSDVSKELGPAFTLALHHFTEGLMRIGPLLIAPHLLKWRFGIVTNIAIAVHPGGVKVIANESSMQFVMVSDVTQAIGTQKEITKRLGFSFKAIVGKGVQLPFANFVPDQKKEGPKEGGAD